MTSHRSHAIDPKRSGDRPARRAAPSGQATVELVALLPLLAVIGLLLWQGTLAGHAAWAAAGAARAAARAEALGADPERAARSRLPAHLRHGFHVHRLDGGGVRVTVRIPAVVAFVRPGEARAAAQMAGQSA